MIWGIIFKKAFVEQLIENKKILSQLSSGIRPKDMELHFEDDMVITNYYDATILYYYYLKALDMGDMQKIVSSINMLEKNLALLPALMQTPIYFDICFVACLTNDMEKAKSFYEKSGKTLQKDKDCNGLRIKAYYEFYVNNNNEAAFQLSNEAMLVTEVYPLKGQAIMEEDLIKQLLQKIGK
ncbi:hypothetical protein [Salipaludibacillus sp. CF4.18]|uniref:hypothetical protein n=1 Tax=Salipaludibacillus sp. CF4.18 TaxID=3373081 RepID=UPI003EE44DEB